MKNTAMWEYFYLMNVIIGITFGYWIFLKVALKRYSLKENMLYFCLTVPVLTLVYISWGNVLEQFIEITLLYLIYRKRPKDHQTLGRLLIIGSTSYMVESLMFLITFSFGIEHSIVQMIFFDIVAYMAIYLIIMKTPIIRLLDRENGKVYFGLMVYMYMTFLGINYMVYFIKSEMVAFLILMLFFIVQLFFAIYLYLTIQKVAKDKLFLQQLDNLKIYTKQLEINQKNLCKFKHDYRNMLISLQLSAQDRHDKELIARLKKYSNFYLDNKGLWQFNDIDNVRDDLLKSLLISKLNIMFQQNIENTFECQTLVEQLPAKDITFDIIRILGIAYDNAIEASLILKNGAKVKSMVYSKEGELEFEIKNRFNDTGKSILELKKLGFTTKKGHSGLGLANIEDIKKKYDVILVEYHISDGWFTFYMSVRVK